MYVKKKTGVKEINFLKSGKFVSFTYQGDANMSCVVGGVIPAGAVYPSNDENATGIVLNETDVSNGSQPVAVIVEGYILEKRLPTAPTDEAKEALKEIKFM